MHTSTPPFLNLSQSQFQPRHLQLLAPRPGGRADTRVHVVRHLHSSVFVGKDGANGSSLLAGTWGLSARHVTPVSTLQPKQSIVGGTSHIPRKTSQVSENWGTVAKTAKKCQQESGMDALAFLKTEPCTLVLWLWGREREVGTRGGFGPGRGRGHAHQHATIPEPIPLTNPTTSPAAVGTQARWPG